MKVKEAVGKMREMTPVELKNKLKDVKEELFNLRFQLATGHLDDFSKIRQIRRNIARIQTILKEKELGIR